LVRFVALGLVALVLSCGAAGAGSPALDTALAAGLKETGAPGAQAAVYRCGKLVWSGAAGVTDLKSKRPVTPSTLFVLASSTKTYTATMIMQLVQHGRLSLGTKLSRFYPRLPNARRITIQNLLRHESGLPEYFDEPLYQRGVMDPSYHWKRAPLLAGLHGSQFRPGTHFLYTNTNFVVLGGIVVKLAHTSVESNFQAMIARPLVLARSTFTYAPSRASLYAHPYAVQSNGRAIDEFVPGIGISSDYVGEVWTDGGISTTAEELARFGDGLFSGRLVNAATLKQMTKIDRFQTGLGLFPGPFDGHNWLGHEGSYGGFESENWHDSKRGVTITVTTNMDERASAADTTSDRIWMSVARAYDRTAKSTPCGRLESSFPNEH
jgi:D-alanyl-D-alanine carboxypeptidase